MCVPRFGNNKDADESDNQRKCQQKEQTFPLDRGTMLGCRGLGLYARVEMIVSPHDVMGVNSWVQRICQEDSLRVCVKDYIYH